jgi:hypothetical protein
MNQTIILSGKVDEADRAELWSKRMARLAGRTANEAEAFGERVRRRYEMTVEECASYKGLEKMTLSFENRMTGLSVELLAFGQPDDDLADTSAA